MNSIDAFVIGASCMPRVLPLLDDSQPVVLACALKLSKRVP
jgi:hypothetical protein